ncbi:hypothetical protein Q2941_48860 [Bradyrhizobium sp. UFLA05-153]
MSIVFGGFRLGLVLAGAVTALTWPHASAAYSPEQQQACAPDALRLCYAFIPDVDRIKVCMIRNKSQLSPACRAFFRSGREPREQDPAQKLQPDL